MNEQGDTVRDLYLIRELETESAKGFSGDVQILQQALQRLSVANELPPNFPAIKTALQAHLDVLQQSWTVDVVSQVPALDPELKLVDLDGLNQARDKTLQVLKNLNEFHQEELSYYGRHYINKKLRTRQLIKSLNDFEFQVAEIDREEQKQTDTESDDDFQQRIEKLKAASQNQFNRQINTLRNQLALARKTFGAATFSYPNLKIAAAERQIADMENRIGGYLLFQSRRKSAFENDLQIRKQAFVSQDGVVKDSDDRLYQAELGRWLELLQTRGQGQGLDAAARRRFSKPNLKVTVQESLVNRLASRPVAEMADVDQVIVGSRAVGWSYTTGLVSLDFVDSPHSALIRLNLAGAIQSSAYTKEGPVTAYTSSNGNFAAGRNVEANVGNLSISKPTATANVYSNFLGTNCIPLVTRIAQQRFSERQWRAEEVASGLARDQVLEQFSEESDVALLAGVEQLEQARSRETEIIDQANTVRRDISELLAQDEDGQLNEPFDLIDPFIVPRFFVTSTDTTLQIGGLLEADNRLASPTDPPGPTVPVDFRIQLHESMLSNLIAPFIQNRLIENWQIRNTIDS